ncbi:hypothetical protein OsI_19596 [Oryza sativa Indica Group]|uniref:FAM91 N-terminal domain-containing protein n=1 Tax=Oryza sativa subsp. indica TaxID=39946 RepID=A2Y3L4_ORYSI|nr:hypothetical protein OsI_19596 [Oryza sativa Indica Group]
MQQQMAATVEEQMMVKAIREELPWESLPKRIQAALVSKDDWHRRIVDYCIRKRLPWTSCFARKICKEGEYYEELMRYLRRNLALYPYHLADHICRVMRISPFKYYCDVLFEAMKNGNCLLIESKASQAVFSFPPIPNFPSHHITSKTFLHT